MRKALPFIMIAAGVFAVYLVFSLSSGPESSRGLDRSVMGYDALRVWLPQDGVAVTNANPRVLPYADAFAIRILPLSDTDLSTVDPVPETANEMFYQQTQRNITGAQFRQRIRTLETLVILPKWRTGYAVVRVAHDSLLIAPDTMDGLLPQVGLRGTKLRRPDPLLSDEALRGAGYDDIAAVIYAAQVFDRATLPDYCAERAGIASGALLITCRANGVYPLVHFLSDPDLMNNHGLAIGGNAAFPARALRDLAAMPAEDAKPVYLDRQPSETLRTLGKDDPGAERYERGATEFARFFEYPFSVIWALMALCLIIAFWRGAVRFGPAFRPQDRLDDTASKGAAIDAKARLLRLAGQDHRMVAEFVRARMEDLAVTFLGSHAGADVSDRLRKALARRDKALAEGLFTSAEALVLDDGSLTFGQMMRNLEIFKSHYERANHATGRVSTPH